MQIGYRVCFSPRPSERNKCRQTGIEVEIRNMRMIVWPHTGHREKGEKIH